MLWEADEVDGAWTLYSGDTIVVACPDAQKQLRITVSPDWDVGKGAIQATPFTGPIDTVTVKLGDKSFEATQDAAVADKVVYVLPADADTVSALMAATNVEVVLTPNPTQTRIGNPSDDGTFDLFGTTCAQINGLK